MRSTKVVFPALLVLAALMAGRQAQASSTSLAGSWPFPSLQTAPGRFKPVLRCVISLYYHSTEYVLFVEKGGMISYRSCERLVELPDYCLHRLHLFLNLPEHGAKKLKHVCHKKVKAGLSPSPAPSPSLSPSSSPSLSPSPSPSSSSPAPLVAPPPSHVC